MLVSFFNIASEKSKARMAGIPDRIIRKAEQAAQQFEMESTKNIMTSKNFRPHQNFIEIFNTINSVVNQEELKRRLVSIWHKVRKEVEE